MAYYSIGGSCLPKFGINDYISKNPTFFFDWLITDIESLVNNFNSELFFRSGYEICDKHLRVKELHTGLKFQHDFPVLENGTVDPKKIEREINTVRERYLRRRNRLLDAVKNDDNPILIRYEYGKIIDEESYESNLRIMLNTFFGIRYKLVIMSEGISRTRLADDTLFCKIETEANKPWRANKESWDLALSFFNANQAATQYGEKFSVLIVDAS